MYNERPPAGFIVAAIGAAALAVSVFGPWYGVSVTASGAAKAQQEMAAVAQQYGNATLQSKLGVINAGIDSVVGRTLFTVSAYRVRHHTSWFLLSMAAIAFLSSLLRLRYPGRRIALPGVLVFLTVLALMGPYRPDAPSDFSVSFAWGLWLALLSSVAIAVGGVMAGQAPRKKPQRVEPILPRRPLPSPGGRDISSPLAMFKDPQQP